MELTMTETIGIKSIIQAVIIVFYVDHGEKLHEAMRIADQYLEELREQTLEEAIKQ